MDDTRTRTALHTLEKDTQRRAQALPSSMKGASRTQQVYAALREDIVRTRLAPGQVVIEPELAQRFGVSKTPVREALQILAVEGLVTVIPRRGYVVRQLGLNDLREVLDLRTFIEPPLAAAATRRSTPEFVEELTAIYSAQVDGDGVAELTDAARAFHECILDASKNNRARGLMDSLFDETTRGHHLVPEISANIHSDVEREGHRAVLAAITAGDADAAEAAMRAHLTDVREAVVHAFLAG
jgi:DNA-binding GntR family transcriptional regulator